MTDVSDDSGSNNRQDQDLYQAVRGLELAVDSAKKAASAAETEAQKAGKEAQQAAARLVAVCFWTLGVFVCHVIVALAVGVGATMLSSMDRKSNNWSTKDDISQLGKTLARVMATAADTLKKAEQNSSSIDASRRESLEDSKERHAELLSRAESVAAATSRMNLVVRALPWLEQMAAFQNAHRAAVGCFLAVPGPIVPIQRKPNVTLHPSNIPHVDWFASDPASRSTPYGPSEAWDFNGTSTLAFDRLDWDKRRIATSRDGFHLFPAVIQGRKLLGENPFLPAHSLILVAALEPNEKSNLPAVILTLLPHVEAEPEQPAIEYTIASVWVLERLSALQIKSEDVAPMEGKVGYGPSKLMLRVRRFDPAKVDESARAWRVVPHHSMELLNPKSLVGSDQ